MKRELKPLVIEEVKNLKLNITKEEADSLTSDYLDGTNEYNCIYGQLTGHCYSNRAHQLINRCYAQVYKVTDKNAESWIETVVLNGPPRKVLVEKDRKCTTLQLK